MGSEEEAVREVSVAYQASAQTEVIRGVQYLVNESGERTAVVISLKDWGELWEDFYDVLASESRKDEPTIPWEALKADLAEEETVRGGV